MDKPILQCGRLFSEEEIALIAETVALFPHLRLAELAATLCEQLEWYTASGTVKLDAAQKLLRRLEAAGRLTLTQTTRSCQGGPRGPIGLSKRSAPQPPLSVSLSALKGLHIERIEGRRLNGLWNEYVGRYHPLGYKQPFGHRMRYFIGCEGGRLGCALFSGASRALAVRDRWIGWNAHQRLQRLGWVTNNSRFLLFPWVRVKNLASWALAELTRRLPEDFDRKWGFRPVLAETFVDPRTHEGTVYKAAGWRYLGLTTGEGLAREGREYRSSPKRVYVKPLSEDFRSILCSVIPKGGGGEGSDEDEEQEEES